MPHMRMASNPRQPSAPKMKAPPHPFPELQGPFEESMSELERQDENEVPSDAASRRTILLDAPTYERVIAGRWKQRIGEKYHPLWKIVAQLSFGIHLLAENLAKSEEEVTQILQGHIDEIDLFLERTTEDFALAQDDIKERMRCLQLPLQHPKVFDRMLEDKAFRNSIVEGNEKIEHIVARTACAMRDSLKDAQKGLDATNSLAQYLASLAYSWKHRRTDHEAVFEAMLENVEGWRDAFIELQSHGDRLGQLLKQLTEVINQMQQRAGEISRRLVRASQKQGNSPSRSSNITYVTRQSASSSVDLRSGTPSSQPPRKPLPIVPNRDSTRQPSSLGQRCDTAQSSRSVNSYRSSNQNQSRAPSREATHSSVRDSNQSRLGTRSPRVVEIKRQSPQGRELAQAAHHVENSRRRSDRSSLRPAELSAELPVTTRRMSPMSETNPMNAGLGITQIESHVDLQSKSHSPASADSTHGSGALGSARLPLTPRSMKSDRDSDQALLCELPSESDFQQISAASSVVPITGGSSLGSPPTTPGWAKQTFDMTEPSQTITAKTAFYSHPPNANLGSPPVLHPTRYNSLTQHARPDNSTVPSIEAPNSEVASSQRTDPIVQGSTDEHNVGSAPPLTNLTITQNKAVDLGNGSKSFIAELEGTTPLSHATTYTQKPLRTAPREVAHEVVELEASQDSQLRPPALRTRKSSNSVLMMTDTVQDSADRQTDVSTSSVSKGSLEEASMFEARMAAGIRKSFIATSIELPGVPVEIDRNESAQDSEVVVGAVEDGDPQSPREAFSKGVDDILMKLEQLSSPSPNLSLTGETMLLTLPATTYKPDRPTGLKTIAESAPQNEKLPAVRFQSPRVEPEPTMARSRPKLLSRNSSESTISSQSQWRAFFKGQLSPADFNSSTPHLPSKAYSQHKAIIDLQRRGQESSPTLGWQWAPETPEIEATTRLTNRRY